MSYNSNTTYIILNTNQGSSITDENGNVYTYNSSFSNYTYASSTSGIVVDFYTSTYSNIINKFILGTNINNIIAPNSNSNLLNLTLLSIPNNVTYIDSQAFYNCHNLEAVYVYSNQPITVGTQVFSYISSNAVLYTTTANINNTSLTQYFSSVVNLNTTNYYIDNSGTFVDLNTVFAPYSGGMDASATGFIVNNYGGITGNNLDLNQIFAINNGTSYDTSTNYIVENYAGLGQSLDLNQIFAPIPIPVTYTQTGATVSSSSTYNTILTFDASYGTFQITSNTNVPIYSEVVGPGGYGGDSLNYANIYVNGGGGGGGGGIVTNTTLFNPNILYIITVGQPSTNTSSTGSASSIIGGSIDISANSGYNGYSANKNGSGGGGASGGGSSGSGGDGGSAGNNGIIIPIEKGNPGGTSSNSNYGGGGGGGGGAILGSYANGGTGGSPFGGNGGTPGSGANGTGYGGGGGGGGGNSFPLSTTPPGQGYQGVVVLYFNV
jgi:hypothetical protein